MPTNYRNNNPTDYATFKRRERFRAQLIASLRANFQAFLTCLAFDAFLLALAAVAVSLLLFGRIYR